MARHTNSNVREPIDLLVRVRPGHRREGLLRCKERTHRCALGRSGIAALKREGDGATPVGRWALRRVFYRPDRVARPRTSLSVVALRKDNGWCDDPADRNYNRLVRFPHGKTTESMWREDHLYDLVVELGYNDLPRIRGKGSAIFMHLAREGYAPTEGCVALSRENLLQVLARCGPGSRIDICY